MPNKSETVASPPLLDEMKPSAIKTILPVVESQRHLLAVFPGLALGERCAQLEGFQFPVLIMDNISRGKLSACL